MFSLNITPPGKKSATSGRNKYQLYAILSFSVLWMLKWKSRVATNNLPVLHLDHLHLIPVCRCRGLTNSCSCLSCSFQVEPTLASSEQPPTILRFLPLSATGRCPISRKFSKSIRRRWRRRPARVLLHKLPTSLKLSPSHPDLKQKGLSWKSTLPQCLL